MKGKLLLFAAAALSLAACQKNSRVEVSSAEEGSIGFNAYTTTSAVTKGSVVKPTDITDATNGKGIGVFAFYEPKATGDFNTYKYTTPDFMYNQRVYNTTSNGWEYEPLKFWPNNDGDKLSFFAYAPYDQAKTWEDLGIKTDVNNNKLTVSFPVAGVANDQQDQLWAAPQLDLTKPSVSEKVNFAFTHVTSQVNLYVGVETNVATHNPGAWTDGDTEIEIKSIEFKDLSSSMTYTYDLPIEDDPVVSKGETQNVKLTSSDFIKTAREINSTNYGSTNKWTKLNESTSTMFLVPETLSTAVVTYTVTTTDPNLTDGKSVITNTVTCDLSSITMAAQKVYNLQFLIGMTSVKVSASVAAWGDTISSQIDLSNKNYPYAFSVSSSKKVLFTKGNLWWGKKSPATTADWHLEANQYDYYPTTGDTWDANHVGNFFWTNLTDFQSGNAAYMPYADAYSHSAQSTSDSFFCGEDNKLTVDNQSGLYALTSDDWTYLLNTRTDANRFAKAKVNDVKGLIIFPDGYNGGTEISGITGVAAVNTTNAAFPNENVTDWSSMETAGCVFLPAVGYRDGSSLDSIGSSGRYWSATPYANEFAYGPLFNNSNFDPASSGDRAYGVSVRLVFAAQ